MYTHSEHHWRKQLLQQAAATPPCSTWPACAPAAAIVARIAPTPPDPPAVAVVVVAVVLLPVVLLALLALCLQLDRRRIWARAQAGLCQVQAGAGRAGGSRTEERCHCPTSELGGRG